MHILLVVVKFKIYFLRDKSGVINIENSTYNKEYYIMSINYLIEVRFYTGISTKSNKNSKLIRVYLLLFEYAEYKIISLK